MSTLRFQYLFNEGTGTAVSDNSAYGNDGSLESDAGWTAAPYNPAVYIPDHSLYGTVRVPVIQPWDKQTTNLPTTSYTVMFWVYFNPGLSFYPIRAIIDKHSSEGTYPHQFTRGWSLIFREAANYIRFLFEDEWWGTYSAVDNKHRYIILKDFDYSKVTGGWHHYAVYLNISTQAFWLYQDFCIMADTTLSFTRNTSVSSANNVDMLVGSYLPTSARGPLNGALFDLRLYEGEVLPTSAYPNYASTAQVTMTPEI